MVICFATCAVIGFCMILNYLALLDYKKYSRNALRVFSETRISRKVFRIICGVLAVVCLGLFTANFFTPLLSAARAMGVMALAFLFALFALVPYSSALWTLDENGIYVYRARRLIPWTQIIQHGSYKKRGTTYLTFRVKQETGEMFKRVFYSVVIPADQVDETRQIIRDFLHAIEKQRFHKQRQEEQKKDLKDRKWY